YQAAVARHQGTDAAALSAARLWQEALDITQAAMGYTTMLLFATMGASAGSESLLTQAYNKLAKQEGDPPATVLVMGYNNIPARAEKSLYDLAQWCKEQPALSAYLSETPTAQILAHLQQGEQADPVQGWQDFRLRLDQHLQQFGHIIYELDFSRPLPLDDPTPVLETCKMYLRGEGANPHQRQRAREQERLQTTQAILARLKGLRRWAFRIALNWGQPMAEVREDALSEIGLGYPILRRYLRELGRRLVEAGALQHPEEIFWLERREIEARLADLDRQQPLDSLAGLVQQRKAFWQRASQETPPPMIPYKKKIMGMNTELFTAIREGDQSGDTLKGVPTSPGKVTAPACVLRGPQDFDQMKAGDVIVAGTTTPAWTPLFAMASAVVTDIGGPLSHGSIVAREYGIPAVMGVGVATRRIRSGQVITVDGSAGTVTFIEKG
ncbi:MAG: hypothetical protein JW726_12165, partial [Anaerolineales bacterium]|nr:hypothetical protein [Anaerolineales bacterium]